MIFAAIAGWLVKLGLGRSLANRVAPFAFAAALLLAVVAGFGTWLHVHDNHVRSADRTATGAQVAKTALDAERAANASDARRQAEIQANDATTRKAIDDATAKDPVAAHAAAGPASRAAAERLRTRAARSGAPAR